MRRIQIGSWAYVIIAAAVFSVATGAVAQTGSTYDRSIDSLTKAFARKTIKWQARSSGQTQIFFGVEEHKGRIAVCGLHNSSGSVPRDVLIRGLALASVSSGGQILVEDLRFFKEFTESRGYPRFRCQVTKFKWNTAFSRLRPDLDFRGEVLN